MTVLILVLVVGTPVFRILMSFPIHIDTISMGLPIVYFIIGMNFYFCGFYRCVNSGDSLTN